MSLPKAKQSPNVWSAFSKFIHYVDNTFHMWGANMRVSCVKVNVYHINTHV